MGENMIIKNGNTFHLQGKNISYIIAVSQFGDLHHYYFGKKLSDRDYSKKLVVAAHALICYDEVGGATEAACLEYPSYGHTDLRTPAFSIKNRLGNTVSKPVLRSFAIKENAVTEVEGMPYILKNENNAQTLEITLADSEAGFEIVLSYTVFDEYDVILRNAKIKNASNEEITVESASSCGVDFEKGQYDVIYFPGAWTRERYMERVSVKSGMKMEIGNAKGGSGHVMNPFVILCDSKATEKSGDAYGFSLIYSGNHATTVECDQYGKVRVVQGLNPFEFEQVLNSGETFETPQTILSYSNDGLGGLSRAIHGVVANNLCRSNTAKKDRPILINNWEATYFDFTEEKLINLAKKAKAVEIELLVLDDGWFGKRNSDNCSLGDWVVNTEKLPLGIDGLSKKINDEGLKFGLWFEPEMANPDSDLFRAHPEWVISVPNVKPSLGRKQYMLDLANPDVCDYIIDVISGYLKSAKIDYIKWDYNRMMTDMPYKGYNHKYTLGLYRVYSTLVKNFPDVLIEGCASGGGRFDLGILAYSPQIWTSDNSDAISRLKIQYGTSMGYPICTMSAHVTASPNHQVGRITPLKTRAAVAYAGMFGYELDITTMSDAEIEEIREQIKFYNEIRTLVRTGDLYRLQSPYEGNYCSWMIVSKDKKEAVLVGVRVLSNSNFDDENIYLDGLCESFNYKDMETGEVFGGDELMYKGITPEYELSDFSAVVKYFKVED